MSEARAWLADAGCFFLVEGDNLRKDNRNGPQVTNDVMER
jgi:hypothetical protein